MTDGFDENSADDFFREDVDPYTKVHISEMAQENKSI